jgi:heptosyltransferase-2
MKHFLIVRQQNNQLGDLLCSVPMYLAIKKKYPDSYISLVTARTNYDIPFKELNPYLDNIIKFQKGSLKNIGQFVKELRKIEYDFGIVPSTLKISRTSNIINFISRAKVRVGVKRIDNDFNFLHFLLDKKSDFYWNKNKIHQINRILDVVEQIGCTLPPEEIKNFKIDLTGEDLKFAEEFIKQNFPDSRPVFGFHPGAGKTGNRWSLVNYLNLIELLAKKYNNYVLLTSGHIDNEITKELTDALKLKNIEYVILENCPVKKLAAILKLINLYVTNDTGVMHLAGFAGAKIISLFGPTNGFEWAPIKANQIYIQSPTKEINDIDLKDVFDKAVTLYDRTR